MADKTPQDKDLVTMGDLNVDPNGVKDDKTPADKEPEVTEVKLGDKSYTVPAEVAAALTAASKAGVDVAALKAQLSEMSGKLEAAVKPPVTKTLAEDGYSVLLYSDPDKAVEKIKGEIIAAVRQEVQVANDQRDFWDEFYSQNKDLKEFDPYVKFVFAREQARLVAAKVTVAEAIGKIAEASKAEILKIRGGAPLGDKSKPIGEDGSDGNSTRSTKSKGSVSEDSPEKVSTASILAARREARKEASKPGKKR